MNLKTKLRKKMWIVLKLAEWLDGYFPKHVLFIWSLALKMYEIQLMMLTSTKMGI
jgi:hypothetical protein